MDWGQVTDHEFEQNKDNHYYIYFATKAELEKALLEFGKAHPELNLITSKSLFPLSYQTLTLVFANL